MLLGNRMEALGWSSLSLCWVIPAVSLSFLFPLAAIVGTSISSDPSTLLACQLVSLYAWLLHSLTGGLVHFFLSFPLPSQPSAMEGGKLWGQDEDFGAWAAL